MDQNAIRRAMKAKQQARKAKAKGCRGEGRTLFENIREDKKRAARREAAIEAGHRNGKALLETVLNTGILIISNERDAQDVKRAAKLHNKHFHWETLPNGDFAIATPKKVPA